MSLKASFKARQAVLRLQKGNAQEAMSLFEQAMEDGLNDTRSILTYSVLLIRAAQYEKAREMLVKIKNKTMSDQERTQLYCNYATCVYKMGELEKGVELLERQHKRVQSGMLYQTLGYLLVEAGAAELEQCGHENTVSQNELTAAEEVPDVENSAEETEIVKKPSYVERALAYNLEALDYDDEDSITLDNLGQVYYRLLNDKESAKTYFEKAIAIKPGQIDTLYFLAQYDLENGNIEQAKEKLETALEGRFSPLNYASKEKISDLLNTL